MAKRRDISRLLGGERAWRQHTMVPSLAEQQRYWDELWGRQGKDYPHSWARRRAAVMLSWLHSLQLERPKILDFGCGIGWFTEQLTDIGPATGIDVSEEAIRLARSRYSRASFLAGDVLEMPLPISEYDVVVSQEVIAHVPDPVKYLARVARVLKPGGYLTLTTPNRFVTKRSDWPPPAPGHIRRWLSRRALMRLLRSDFRVLKTTTVVPLGYRGVLRIVNSYKLNRLLTLVLGSDATTLLKERAGLGWTRVVLAQKRS